MLCSCQERCGEQSWGSSRASATSPVPGCAFPMFFWALWHIRLCCSTLTLQRLENMEGILANLVCGAICPQVCPAWLSGSAIALQPPPVPCQGSALPPAQLLGWTASLLLKFSLKAGRKWDLSHSFSPGWFPALYALSCWAMCSSDSWRDREQELLALEVAGARIHSSVERNLEGN